MCSRSASQRTHRHRDGGRKPGEDFVLETCDWTGGFIKNDDCADDVREIDRSIVNFLSGPVRVEGAEPGDLLVVDLLDICVKPDSLWGFHGFFSKKVKNPTFEGISVDESGKHHYLVVHVVYRPACVNAREYLTKFGYTRAQAYAALGTAPVQGHISGVVDIPNACATLWLPTQILDFDISPNESGPVKHIKGGADIPISPPHGFRSLRPRTLRSPWWIHQRRERRLSRCRLLRRGRPHGSCTGVASRLPH